MNVEVINRPLRLDLYGFSGVALNKDYVGTAFMLSGKMWETVKKNNLKNKGINIWVYQPNETVFTGVELSNVPPPGTGLEHQSIILTKYVYYKHIGPYNQIKQVGLNIKNEVNGKGLETCLPHIEIYGHWTNDETKLEVEILMSLK
jgi:hypothetical protein